MSSSLVFFASPLFSVHAFISTFPPVLGDTQFLCDPLKTVLGVYVGRQCLLGQEKDWVNKLSSISVRKLRSFHVFAFIAQLRLGYNLKTFFFFYLCK